MSPPAPRDTVVPGCLLPTSEGEPGHGGYVSTGFPAVASRELYSAGRLDKYMVAARYHVRRLLKGNPRCIEQVKVVRYHVASILMSARERT